MRLNGNEDERHYDRVLNKYMHIHTYAHTHAAFHMGVMYIYSHIIAYIERHLGPAGHIKRALGPPLAVPLRPTEPS